MVKIAKEASRASGREDRRAENGRMWAETSRLWRESGQTQAQYCAQRGLSVWMLRKWIVDLGAKGRVSKQGPRMLPITLRPGHAGLHTDLHSGLHSSAALLVPQARGEEAGLEIALPNGTRIRAAGMAASELTRVIARSLRC